MTTAVLSWFCSIGDHVCARTGATCCEWKGPTTCSISCLVDWRILLKDENEPYLKVYQEVMFHSFVEVDERNEETMQIFRSQFGSRGFSV